MRRLTWFTFCCALCVLMVYAGGTARVHRAHAQDPQTFVDMKCLDVNCSGIVAGDDGSTFPPTPVPECILLSNQRGFTACQPKEGSFCTSRSGLSKCNGFYFKGEFPVQSIGNCYAGYIPCGFLDAEL